MGVTSYSSLLTQVNVLKTQLLRWRRDEEYREAGGKIYYAIDNNVITLITAPWDTEWEFYLSALIEGNDTAIAIEAIAYLLGEYFLNTDTPYLIVPPGQNELEGMWNEVHRKASRRTQVHEDFFKKILSEEWDISEHSDKDLFKHSRELLSSIYGTDGPITELKRISRVLSSGSIRRIETVLNEDKLSPFVFPNNDDEKDIDIRKTKWLALINKIRPHTVSARRNIIGSNIVDAGVLARIEWMNEALDKKGYRTRLSLITGDSHIERAASEYLVAGESFSSRFIRSPMAFLADPMFYEKVNIDKPKSKLNIVDWIDDTFQEENTSSYRPQNQSTKRSKELLAEVKSASKDWTTYLRSEERV